jgi:hypothetical protein
MNLGPRRSDGSRPVVEAQQDLFHVTVDQTMPDQSSDVSGESDETILEYIVRERLTRQQIKDLLDSLGSPTSGNRDETGERLLSQRGLKAREVLALLELEDLKRTQKRFDISAPKAPGTLLGAFFSDEKKELVERIAKAASQQRAPRSKSAKGSVEAPSSPELSRDQPPPLSMPKSVRPDSLAEPPLPPQLHNTQPTQAVSTLAAAGLPSFQEVRDFVGAYRFSYQWDQEDLYEAELLGALRGRFGISNALRQQGESGRIYDIVVRNSSRIEVKLPKVKGDLDRMSGQVRRYLALHPGGIIVVIIGFQMRNQQDIHAAQEELEGAGAAVFTK